MMREHVDPSGDERQRAAMAYLVWPVALLDLLQARTASRWFEVHLRQAALLGAVVSALILALMLLPLVVVLLLRDPTASTIIWIYTPAFGLDLIAIGAAFVYAIRLSLRAARGEHFRVPFVWGIASRGFTAKQ